MGTGSYTNAIPRDNGRASDPAVDPLVSSSPELFQFTFVRGTSGWVIEVLEEQTKDMRDYIGVHDLETIRKDKLGIVQDVPSLLPYLCPNCPRTRHREGRWREPHHPRGTPQKSPGFRGPSPSQRMKLVDGVVGRFSLGHSGTTGLTAIFDFG